MDVKEKIVSMCGSLAELSVEDFENALIRMCIAHVFNGGAFVGKYETAIRYLLEFEDD